VSIYDNYYYDLNIVPNPSDGAYNIVFNSEEMEHIKIELFDLLGNFIEKIFEGVVGRNEQIISVDKSLLNGTYFLKFTIKDKILFRIIHVISDNKK